MIKAEGISKSYGNAAALKDVSFEIGESEICGYIGVNGSGKSTTLKILGGLIKADNGEASIGGFNVNTDPIGVKKITGYLPEGGALFSSLTVKEFILFAGKLHRLEEEIVKHRLKKFAKVFSFTENINKTIGELSKGNRQKVLITTALLHNPKYLLLDEPLNGLDTESIYTFQNMLVELAKRGRTIIYSSHLLDLIEKIATKIIILEKGRKIEDASISEIKSRSDFESLEKTFRKLKPHTSAEFDYDEIFS